MTSIPSCQLSCQNGGYCNFVSSDESSLQQIFTSGGLIQKCVCPPGYTGIACETIVEECQLPKFTCHNGLPCSLNLEGEWDGHYVCDCSVADAMSKFAGSMCRNPATTYCGSGEITNRSFCTNGGLCLENLMEGGLDRDEFDTHLGCKCPPEFEGDHCEYVKGMAPTINKEPSSERTPADELAAVTVELAPAHDNQAAESSPSLTIDHIKNSKELPVSDGDGQTPVHSTVWNTSSSSEPASNSVTNPVLQSNTILTTHNIGSFHDFTPNASSKQKTGSIIGLTISIMGISLFGLAILLRNRRQRKLRSRIVSNHSEQYIASLDRNNYTDETPIRVKIVAEDEQNELELDEILGEDDDVVSIGECSLEEIELEDGAVGNYREYLRNISDEFDGSNTDDEKEQSNFPNIFA